MEWFAFMFGSHFLFLCIFVYRLADSNNMTEPPKKKSKNGAKKKEEALSMEAATDKAWEAYQNYIESATQGDDDEEGDMDELEEMIHQILLNPQHNLSLTPLRSIAELKRSTKSLTCTMILPVLISVGYYQLANVAIAQCLEHQHDQTKQAPNQNQTTTPKNQETEFSKLVAECQHLIQESLRWYPENSATWSMGANFGRMLQVLSPTTVCQWYEQAVTCAGQVKSVALAILESEDCSDDKVKEWVESLFLNQVVGSEYVVGDEDEEDDDEDKDEELKEDEEEEGYYSPSGVESTARFMLAMLHSTAGRHDLAKEHLEHFPVTHRVHPNVWKLEEITSTPQAVGTYDAPVQYQSPKEDKEQGVLPPAIYQRLCKVFEPNATYWTDSDYDHRGYYSYFHDIPPALQKESPERFVASNLMEDVIWNHLYPLVNQKVQSQPSKDNGGDDQAATTICGAEWWVHTRPVQANLGHNLHFDTDEALLAQDSVVSSPIYSSVLYLTGGSADREGGATIVFDQTPDAELVASKAWRCIPEDNTYLIFPGSMLHGVLPCPGNKKEDDNGEFQKMPTHPPGKDDVATIIQNQWISKQSEVESRHRLTLMVGFWTRRVPDKMKKRRLYGPCGPLPPRPSAASSKEREEGEHRWVDEMFEGYEPMQDSKGPKTNLCAKEVPIIVPAWETLLSMADDQENGSNTEDGKQQEEKLEIPVAIDHRFFVHNAPKCFRDSLFERTEDEDEEC